MRPTCGLPHCLISYNCGETAEYCIVLLNIVYSVDIDHLSFDDLLVLGMLKFMAYSIALVVCSELLIWMNLVKGIIHLMASWRKY